MSNRQVHAGQGHAAQVNAVQSRLKKLRFDPGPVDGIRGRRTIAAIKAFQWTNRLWPDGIAGRKTLARLFPEGVSQVGEFPRAANHPWLDLARSKMGLHERRNNSALKRWLKSDGGSIGDPARIPWCGDFVETCIAVTLPDEPLPTNPYSARNWAKFGRSCKPQPGAVLVFKRGKGGHVGFYVGEDTTAYRVLGGNQSNAVTITRVSKTRCIGVRWPATALPAAGGAVRVTATGELSTNEA